MDEKLKKLEKEIKRFEKWQKYEERKARYRMLFFSPASQEQEADVLEPVMQNE